MAKDNKYLTNDKNGLIFDLGAGDLTIKNADIKPSRSGSYEYESVREFHKAFGHPYNDKPTIMDKETALTRSIWKIEEIIEFLNASVGGDKEAFDELITRLMSGIQNTINKERGKKVDDILVAQADALTDLSYFNYGSFTILGVEPQALFDIVQKANMAKLGEDGKPIYRKSDGKIQKPEGWEENHAPEPKIRQHIEKLRSQ